LVKILSKYRIYLNGKDAWKLEIGLEKMKR